MTVRSRRTTKRDDVAIFVRTFVYSFAFYFVVAMPFILVSAWLRPPWELDLLCFYGWSRLFDPNWNRFKDAL